MSREISPEQRQTIDTVKAVIVDWTAVVDPTLLLAACMETSIALHIHISKDKADAIVGFEALKIGIERAILSSFDEDGRKLPAKHSARTGRAN